MILVHKNCFEVQRVIIKWTEVIFKKIFIDSQSADTGGSVNTKFVHWAVLSRNWSYKLTGLISIHPFLYP